MIELYLQRLNDSDELIIVLPTGCMPADCVQHYHKIQCYCNFNIFQIISHTSDISLAASQKP